MNHDTKTKLDADFIAPFHVDQTGDTSLMVYHDDTVNGGLNFIVGTPNRNDVGTSFDLTRAEMRELLAKLDQVRHLL